MRPNKILLLNFGRQFSKIYMRVASFLFIFIFSFLGCANWRNSNKIVPNNVKVYNVKPFKIVVLNEKELNSIAAKYFDYPVYAFYLPWERTIYVPYGSETNEFSNNKLPNIYFLGHEVLHLKEVEGNWHK